jgi:hypothetical protein
MLLHRRRVTIQELFATSGYLLRKRARNAWMSWTIMHDADHLLSKCGAVFGLASRESFARNRFVRACAAIETGHECAAAAWSRYARALSSRPAGDRCCLA